MDENTHLVFSSAFPEYEGEAPEDDEDIEPDPPGKPTLAFIRDELEKRGYAIDRTHDDDPEPEWKTDNGLEKHKFYGWNLVVIKNDQRITLMIQGGTKQLLIGKQSRGLVGSVLGGERSVLNETMATIEELLKNDARFKDITRMTEDEFTAAKIDLK